MTHDAPAAPATQSRPDTVQDEIRAASARWRQGFQDRDASSVAALYRSNAALLPPPPRPGPVSTAPMGLEGRGAIEEFIRGYLEILVSKHNVTATSITPVGSEAAVECGIWSATHIVDGSHQEGDGYYLRLWMRGSEGEWQIHREAFN